MVAQLDERFQLLLTSAKSWTLLMLIEYATIYCSNVVHEDNIVDYDEVNIVEYNLKYK